MENKQSSWKNHEHEPMEQMRRAFLSEIKGLKKEIDLLKLQIQEEVKEKYALYKRIKKLTKNGKNRTNNT